MGKSKGALKSEYLQSFPAYRRYKVLPSRGITQIISATVPTTMAMRIKKSLHVKSSFSLNLLMLLLLSFVKPVMLFTRS